MQTNPNKGPKGPSNNHPNRNWRRTMRAATENFLLGIRWQDGGVHMMTPGEIKQILSSAYQAGYEAGRNSTQRRG